MQKFIARENIKRFRRELENTPNEQKKATLRVLLAEEQAKLAALEAEDKPSREPPLRRIS